MKIFFEICFLYFIALPTALLASHRIPHRTPFLGNGYDLKVGNPEGNSLFTNENDPGLKPTRSIIILDDQTFPFGSTCIKCVSTVLNNSIREYLADDMIKYYRQIRDRWTNIDEDASNELLRVGGNCKALGEVKQLFKESKSVMVTKEISKIYVEARLNYKHKFTLNPEFIKCVCSLPNKGLNEETRREFNNLFKTWGTHVITEVSLGEKEIQRNIYGEREYVNVVNLVVHSKQATTISTNYDPKFIPDILDKLAKLPKVKYNILRFGSMENPVPIKMKLESISNILSSVEGMCEWTEEKSFFIETVKEAMRDYLMVGEELEFITRDYSDFTNWPEGTFSLPKTIHDCPKGWKYGKRRHDTDDKTPYHTYYNENWIVMQKNALTDQFNFEFCSQTQKSLTARKWGRGNYCIFRYGLTCPSGFVDTKIYFDDEDNGNNNFVQGTLPEGVYGKDTTYYLCCRKDGDTFPLVLPYTSPFVLMPINNHGCPRVFGMQVTAPIWVNIDCDGDAQTSACTTRSGADPACNFYEHNRLRLWFCYYE